MKYLHIALRLATLAFLLSTCIAVADEKENAATPVAQEQAAPAEEATEVEQPAAVEQAAEAEQAAAAEQAVQAEQAVEAEQAAAVAEAEKSMAEALQSIEQARALLASENAAHAGAEQANVERAGAEQASTAAQAREELSRAHRQLRDASQDIAQAHREMALADREVRLQRLVLLGDRPVIGVVLGDESSAGVKLRGVSPGGPAERAGMKQGDILTSIGDVSLADRNDGSARQALAEALQEAPEGKDLAVTVVRDGTTLPLTVVPETREPLSWQAMVPLEGSMAPLHPMPPGALPPPGAALPPCMMEGMEMPAIDEAAMAARVQAMTDRARELSYMFINEDGETVEFNREIAVDGGPISPLGRRALDEMDIMFDLPRTSGLELTSLNAELGKYFKAERGVLVISALSGNAYGLEAGDVISTVGTTEVNTPADLLRVLRVAEPGSEIELNIRRNRHDRTLTATVPENLLGLARSRRARAKSGQLTLPAHFACGLQAQAA